MSFARTRALRSLQSSLRHGGARATPRISNPVRTQLAVGRRYASDGAHGHGEPSSDIPWLIGAIAVTIPGCWFLWPSASHADAGHHGDHEEHAESHDEEAEAEDEKPAEDAEPAEEAAPAAEPESKDEPAEEAKQTEAPAKPSGSEGESQTGKTDANKVSDKDEGAESKETPASGGDTDDAQFKGQMKEGSAGNDDTRKVEPDSKGGYKKRIDSGLANDLTGSDAGQQAGMSNTQTKHSTKPHEDPEKSKKGDGTTETAKQMGPVDPSAPVR